MGYKGILQFFGGKGIGFRKYLELNNSPLKRYWLSFLQQSQAYLFLIDDLAWRFAKNQQSALGLQIRKSGVSGDLQ
jgi:hypothetical protein